MPTHGGGAIFSADRMFRYALWREWGSGLPSVTFCLLNPSTADAERDDPTIRRCMGFARRWGFGALTVVNLFAFRATRPQALYAATDPIGPENDEHIAAAARAANIVVAGWGAHGRHLARGAAVLATLAQAAHLGLTRLGEPRHPLYLRADVAPRAFCDTAEASRRSVA